MGRHKGKHHGKRGKRLLVFVFFVGLVAIFGTTVWFNVATRSKTYDADNAAIPAEDIAIIFGAGAMPDGTPSPYLRHRLDSGVSLYKKGKVKKFLLSGDNRDSHYNEPAVMQKYMVEQGIPNKDLVLDYAGLSTYDTCYRAKEIFGVDRAMLITHGYHMPRALFICRKLGVESVGAAVAWHHEYVRSWPWYIGREILSTDKNVVQLFITKPKPILGTPEPISL